MAKHFSRTLLNAAATDETAVEYIPGNDEVPVNGYTHTIEWSTGVSVGVVEIEGAHSTGYTGTWANITTVTYASGSPKVEYVYSPAMFPVVRHRISTAISGGTVTTKISGAR